MAQPGSVFTQSNPNLAELVIAVVVGTFLGVLVVFLPPLWVGVTAAILIVALLALRRPEIALLGLLVMLCTVFPDRLLPEISIGVGHLYIADLIIIALFVLIAVRWLLDRRFNLVFTPLDLPLILFIFWAILTGIAGVLLSGNDFRIFVSEARIILYYLIFFLVVQLIRTRPSLNLFLKWFFLLPTIVAIIMLAQYSLGISLPFLAGRVETLITSGKTYEDVTRITDTLGEGLVTAAFMAKTVLLFRTRSGVRIAASVIQWVILGIGFILTFNRTHWLMGLMAIGLMFFLIRGSERKRLISWALVLAYAVPAATLFLLWFLPDTPPAHFVAAFIERIQSISSEGIFDTNGTGTLTWRSFEYDYALIQLKLHPLEGIGLGALYRPTLPTIDHIGFDGRYYTHNGHLWILLKTGLIGYLVFLSVSFLVVFRGLRNLSKIKDYELRGVVLGFTLTMVGILLGSITHPIIMTLYWVPVIAVLMGINEVIYRQAEPSRPQPALGL